MFSFQQFTIHQDRCAMKVGTDGTLLGAWADAPPCPRVLDIGTGTGLIALMMAQRFPQATVTAIDIDPDAVSQAKENILASPFASRITVIQGDITQLALPSSSTPLPPSAFDAIVCNPPFFVDALTCPDTRRTMARHAATLSYAALMEAATLLLSDRGELSLILPYDSIPRMEAEAALAGLFKSRQCVVSTTPRKAPRRCLLAFRRHPADSIEQTAAVLEQQPGQRSQWYQQLTKDFYLQ